MCLSPITLRAHKNGLITFINDAEDSYVCDGKNRINYV